MKNLGLEEKITSLIEEGYELYLREDGRIEWVCEHYIGHTVYVPKDFSKTKSYWRHGCDNCCEKNESCKRIKNELKNY